MEYFSSWQVLRVIMATIMLVSPTLAYAKSALEFDVEWTEVAGTNLNVEDIRELPQSKWTLKADGENLNFGISDSVYWLRIRVPANASSHLVEIGFPLLGSVRVYWFVDGDIVGRHATGSDLVFDSRPISHRNFVFPIPNNSRPVKAYIRVENEGVIQVPLQIVDATVFSYSDQLNFGLQTVFLGAMLALILYNLFIFITVRQVAYLWYILTVTTSTIVLLNYNGLLFQWLWPEIPALNRYFATPAMSANFFFAAMFTINFLNLRRYSPVFAMLLQLIAFLSLASFFYGLLGDYQNSVIVISLLAIVVIPLAWLIGLVSWYRRQPFAGFYVAAWTPLLCGYFVMVISENGLIPSNLLTKFAPQIGVAIEALLLSFALGYRINIERQKRIKAQALALQTQRQANETLEARVQTRTKELETANKQLKEIASQDGLTGVANRRRFDEELEVEWKRALRHGHALSLIIIDIDHFKRVNDDMGHLAGDHCLVNVANVCANLIQRPRDLFARYGGEEFAALLPETEEASAIFLAERLRNAIEKKPLFVHEAAVHLSVSVGVATMLPQREHEYSDLIAQADEALYMAKNAGRNRVMVFRQNRP